MKPWKKELNDLIDKHLKLEESAANTWHRRKSTTFVEILRGLKANVKNLLSQYDKFTSTFQAHEQALKPIIQGMESRSPVVLKRKNAEAAGASVSKPVSGTVRKDDGEEDDGVDEELHSASNTDPTVRRVNTMSGYV